MISAEINTEIAVLILLGVFVLLMLIRVPVAFSLFLSALACSFYVGIDPKELIRSMVSGLSNFTLLAIPLFILMGEIMGSGGISDKIVKLANAIVGRVRGGLAIVNCLASKLFGGVSGSPIADVSSLGTIMIPMMKKQGYDEGFTVGITVATSCQSALIPPSHNMVMYSILAVGASVGDLFMAGLVPGVMLGVIMIIYCFIAAIIKKYPLSEKMTIKERLIAIVQGVIPMLTVVIILVGVSFGFFTATESAAIACLYAFILTFFVYRKIKLVEIFGIMKRTLRTLAMVLTLIASAAAFSFVMTRLRIPDMLTAFMMGVSDNKYVVYFLIVLLLLLLGTIMDMAPMILIMTPIMLPVAENFGMHPVHFGVVLIFSLTIGLCTPPVGTALFTGCAVGKISIERASKALLPLYIPMIAALLLVTYIPAISLWLPSVISGN
ncbi:MAG: TRAP transporter large permease [Oscillospiraceae bacterium]|nr:TRAP transporter large permease [Oscillospiraceae bacterium]